MKFLILIFLISCGPQSAPFYRTLAGKAIVGDLNWTLAPPSHSSIGLGRIVFSEDKWCNAFSVSSELVITNAHCLSKKEGTFQGKYSCYLEYHDFDLDFALFRCPTKNPYSLPLDPFSIAKLNQKVFIYQVSCSFFDNDCPPQLRISSGFIKNGENYHCEEKYKKREIFYDADTANGSSGSPVFLNGRVIAIHSRGHGVVYRFRGDINSGVSLNKVFEHLKVKAPNRYEEITNFRIP